MSVNVRIRNGLCPDPTTGDGGVTEGDIRGSFSDIIDVVGVKDLAGGHALVTQNSPAAMSVLVAPGVVYIPNADYNELDSNQVKFWEAVITVSTAVAITANTSGSTRIDLICVKMDTAVTPDEHASNIATLVAVAGTPGAGVPATPDNYAKLVEVEVANGASTIVTADITDSRVQSDFNEDYVTKSKGLTFTEISEPSTPSANKVIVYAKDVGGVSKLFFKQDDGTEVEIGTGGGSTDGWTAAETWEYVSVDDPTGIFKVNADVTGKYSAAMRIKMTNGGNTIYGIITVVNAYGADEAGYTYIKFLHQIDPTDSLALYLMANSAITANYYSTQKSPYGFPLEPNKWSVVVTDSTDRTQLTPTGNTWYNLNSTNIVVPIGSWNGYYELVHGFGGTTAGDYNVVSTLSTANNSESNSSYTARQAGNSIRYMRNQCSKRIILELSSKTTYYINTKTEYSDLSSIKRQDCVIKFTCAYL